VQRLSCGQAQVPQDALDIDITLIAKLQFALCASDGAGKPRRRLAKNKIDQNLSESVGPPF
jgi:hypothetical protein